ncbi:hypothetical protein CC80DRAFT_190078 [Byssothecium circinans]|uniref:C2H2-type domain-containing protein n=1 Tax=Byssothecium circinans TaxID=147558 RepID=A0A6A5TH42_9PLEO|nr:hypothetical protein CC80DRAFT_190078 [Byssothecium circinans]
MEGLPNDDKTIWPRSRWSGTTSVQSQPFCHQYPSNGYTVPDGNDRLQAYEAPTVSMAYQSVGPYTNTPGLSPGVGHGHYGGGYQPTMNVTYGLEGNLPPASQNKIPPEEWHCQDGAQQEHSAIPYDAQYSPNHLLQDSSHHPGVPENKPSGNHLSKHFQNTYSTIYNPTSGQPSNVVSAPPRTILPNPNPEQSRRPSSGSLSDSSTAYSIQCTACGETLTGPHANGNLTRHRRSQRCTAAVEKRSYECDRCDAKFQRSDALLTHKRKKHGHPPGLPRSSHVDGE